MRSRRPLIVRPDMFAFAPLPRRQPRRRSRSRVELPWRRSRRQVEASSASDSSSNSVRGCSGSSSMASIATVRREPVGSPPLRNRSLTRNGMTFSSTGDPPDATLGFSCRSDANKEPGGNAVGIGRRGRDRVRDAPWTLSWSRRDSNVGFQSAPRLAVLTVGFLCSPLRSPPDLP